MHPEFCVLQVSVFAQALIETNNKNTLRVNMKALVLSGGKGTNNTQEQALNN